MLASQLFWRIFAVYAGLTVISTLMFAGMLSWRYRAALERQWHERLRDDAILMRDLWEAQGTGELPEAPKLSRPMDVDFITRDEAILSTKRDIQTACETGEASGQRTSNQGQSTEVTYALRVGPPESPRGVVVVSMPRPSAALTAPLLDWKFWSAAAVMVGLGLALTHRVVSRIVGPLETLTIAARQIAAGETPRETPIHSHNEIGTLAQAIDSMNRQLALRIADLQAQRKQLQHNNEQLETVMEAMVEGVIAVDDQERVILANRAAFQLLEMSPTATVGRPVWEAVRQPRIDELVRQALRGESPERLEFQVTRAQITISVAASRLPGDPCPGAVLVLHDVTELRRLEHLRREFVANVSHELKTPLTSIAAYTETLLDGAIDDPHINREFLQRIEEQTDRLQALIGDLLSIARMETEDSAYELIQVNVADVISASIDAHQAVAESKGIQLTCSGPTESIFLWADPDGLLTILDNLLDNAINYTPQGGQVAVRWFSDGDWLQIDVADTGVGIAKEHQARIFERFFRVDRARSREIGGTGLGLSIVKHLCQLFGGSVIVTSQLNQGSTFSIRLRRVMSDATIKPVPLPTQSHESKSRNKLNEIL